MGVFASGVEEKIAHDDEASNEGMPRKYVPIRPAFRPLLPKSSADSGSVNRGPEPAKARPSHASRLHYNIAEGVNGPGKKRRAEPIAPVAAVKTPVGSLRHLTAGHLPATVAPANLINKRRKLSGSISPAKSQTLNQDTGLASPPLSITTSSQGPQSEAGKQIFTEASKLLAEGLPASPENTPADPFDDPLFCAAPFNQNGQNAAGVSFDALPLDNFTDQFLSLGAFPAVEDRPDHFDPMEFFGPAVDIF